MIKPVVNSYNGTDFVITVDVIMSEKAFLKRSGTRPNSYAWRLARHLYKRIFIGSLDLKRDFDLYYKIEYGEFREYLRKRQLLTRDEASVIAKEYGKAAAIFHYTSPYSFLESNPGEVLLKKLLHMDGKQ